MSKQVFLSIIMVMVFSIQQAQAFSENPEKLPKDESLKTRITQKTSGPSPSMSDNPRLTLNYRDMDIRDAFSSLAMEFKINIVLSNEVQGAITMHLFGQTLEEVLATLAVAGGYAYKKEGFLHHIYKPTKEEIQEEQEATQMRMFKFNFIEIAQVKKTLNAIPGLKPMEIHEPTKTVIVNDTPENIKKVEKILKFMDALPRQVLIEAKILEVTLTDDMAFGVDWKAMMSDVNVQTGNLSNAVLPDVSGTSPVANADSRGIFANIIAGVGSDYQVSLAIDALKEKTDVNTVSTPKVLAIHGKPAKVQVGGKQGYRETTTTDGVTTETIAFIDTGVILEITPYIDDNNNILLNVMPSINSAVIEEGLPVVSSTTVSTWLMSKNEETVFIGGLLETSQTETKDGIPILGDIPVLEYLFSRTITQNKKTELVILITPKIIDANMPLQAKP